MPETNIHYVVYSLDADALTSFSRTLSFKVVTPAAEELRYHILIEKAKSNKFCQINYIIAIAVISVILLGLFMQGQAGTKTKGMAFSYLKYNLTV